MTIAPSQSHNDTHAKAAKVITEGAI